MKKCYQFQKSNEEFKKRFVPWSFSLGVLLVLLMIARRDSRHGSAYFAVQSLLVNIAAL